MPSHHEHALAAHPGSARCPVVRGHAAVRAAAKDWTTFSSALQGDADVRDYRQLPLEVDPPAHDAYRALLLPAFGRVEVGAMEPAFRTVAAALVREAVARGRCDAVHDLAFPMVLQSLAIALGRPQDVEEWRTWGLETWRVHADGTRDGELLDRYLDRVIAEAVAAPDAAGDLYARLAAARLDGRALSASELRGVIGLVLAGGRDTVVKLVAGAIWHLAQAPDERARLAAAPSRLPVAIDEWLRWLSPLPRMPRLLAAAATIDGVHHEAGCLVAIDFASANHDASIHDAPDVPRLDRRPNPHVAFGAGPHTCVGAHLARVQARVLLETLLGSDLPFALDGDCSIVWRPSDDPRDARVPAQLHRVPIRFG